MAGIEWARAPGIPIREGVLSKLPRLLDWETAITLGLVLGAALSVSGSLEGAGWSRNMPPLTTVTIAAVAAALLLSRARLHSVLAWPLSLLIGAAVVGWQTLAMAGPGSVEQRAVNVYDRFDAWLDVLSSGTVTNDSLPFNVFIIAVTWLGVFFFAWSVFRWRNAWIGLIPGGVALFVDLALVGDTLTGAIVMYILLGFLLVMQTGLLTKIDRWRREGADYPPMLNLTFLNFSFWALMLLVVTAWILPAGPYSAPGPVQSLTERGLEAASPLVRLAGPLRSHKVIPIHSYAGVLPFQGSIKLGDRELMAVSITDPELQGPLLLRGTVYEQYEGGGWRTAPRRGVTLPTQSEGEVREGLVTGELQGMIVPLRIEMLAKSVVGTVLFTPGEVVSVNQDLRVEVTGESVGQTRPGPSLSRRGLSDEDVLALLAEPGYAGVDVIRDARGRVVYIERVDLTESGLVDAVALDPGARVKRHRTYNVVGFIPAEDPEALRRAPAGATPIWLLSQYTALPRELPAKIGDLASQIASEKANAYDRAKAIEDYLRAYPVDYGVEDTPANQDTVDYFLFESRRGYFDYHASAMVVMLRTLGIPARLAVGFEVNGADLDPERGALIVRDRDSFAWPEVYFAEHGWVAFNPTPDRPAVIRPSRMVAGAGGSQALDPNILDQLPVSGDPVINLPEQGGIGITGPASSQAGGGGTGYWPLALGAMAAFVAAIAGAGALGWRHSVAGLPPAQQAWEKTVRLASWGGLPPGPGETPHDYARVIGKRYGCSREAENLAASYARSRYGRTEAEDDDTRGLSGSWRRMRGPLIGGVIGRPFRKRRQAGQGEG